MSSTLVSKLGDSASRSSAGSTTQVYSSKEKLAARTSLLPLLLVSHQSHLPLLAAAAYQNTEYLVPGTNYQLPMVHELEWGLICVYDQYQDSVIANYMFSYSVYSYDDRAYSYGLIKPKN